MPNQHASSTPSQASSVIEGVRRIAGKAAERAAEIDQLGSFPSDLFDELQSTGVFKSLVPKVFGGLELSLGTVNEAIIEGARGNSSLGWLLMFGIAQPLAFGQFPEQTLAKLFRERPHARIRGAIAPKGIEVPVKGGYRVTVQWPFASGGPNPGFFAGSFLVMGDGQPRSGPSGLPNMLTAHLACTRHARYRQSRLRRQREPTPQEAVTGRTMATQHAMVRADRYRLLGSVLTGKQLSPMELL